MALLDSLFQFIMQGFVAGLPAIVVMAIPFVLGLIIGFLLRKILKIAIIAAIILFIITYFGLFNLSFDSLKDLVAQYGPIAAQYAVLILGILPLSVGLVIGVIIGFLI
jgi:uncharacterized membrane protein (Fun14 family)